MTETETKEKELSENLLVAYENDEEEAKYAVRWIGQINEDLELREKSSLVTNGIAYTNAYEYNERKAINYSPPRNPKDDREVTMGLVHEKIISFMAIFLKYIFKRQIKCYNNKGQLIKGMGKIYELAVEYSFKLEKLSKKIALIYWEVFTQGNAFVLEDWVVKMVEMPKAYMKNEKGDKVLVTPDNMDYTYEFLDGLDYEKGDMVQTRMAESKLLDGRSVIWGNPEIEDEQKQPRMTLEFELTRADAEAMFGTLNRWNSVPKTRDDITAIVGEKKTLFDSTRHKDPKDQFILHCAFDKENNRLNYFLNGLMMLSRKTPMSLFYPRMNYPVSNFCAERLRGSIYARSIPAKTKFNADFLDWALKMLANKFEQGVDPAILSKGRWTITRDIFRGGNVSHGVSTDDYEKADPENKGMTQPEYNFTQMLKDILESQTINPTTSGELSTDATATEINTVEANQLQKLGGLLDGMVLGWVEMTERRAESVESKYTIKQKETIVDGKKISVYQNFTVNVAGVENVVVFDENVGSETYDTQARRDELFERAYQDKKRGSPTEYYLANPNEIRNKQYHLVVEVKPERFKDTQLQLIQMWDDFAQRLNIFGRETNIDFMKKEYLEISGKPDEVFTSKIFKQLEEEERAAASYNEGSFGKPTVKRAAKEQAGVK